MGQTVRDEILANPDKAGGVYFAYPGPADSLAKAPEGYEAFYISHYGRHGSRYLISDNDFLNILRPLQAADSVGVLTAKGKGLLSRITEAWSEAEGRGGELTPLGARQHKEIAQRMYRAYPMVFSDSAEITARSTQVMRCAHSMMAFCEGLKELNPALVIPKESAKRWMNYLCWWTPEAGEWKSERGPWKKIYDDFEKANIHPGRLYKSLFSVDSDKLKTILPSDHYISPAALMWGLYWIAVDMQNMANPIDIYDIFTREELYALWRVNNLSFYIHNSSFPLSEGLVTADARNLLRNIVETADYYVGDVSQPLQDLRSGATLRFGHDGNITPLAALMKIDGFCGEELDPEKVEEAWANFKVTPMASNMQMIFFHPVDGKGPLLVKVMMNEHDAVLPIPYAAAGAPFYEWPVLRRFLVEQIDAATAVIEKNKK